MMKIILWKWSAAVDRNGAPGEIRTHDLCLRRAGLPNFIIRFNELNPVACTLEKKQYRFFANWDYITEFYRRDIDKIHIAIHTNLSEDEIKQYTLLQQLAVSFSSIGDHNLANLVNVIKQFNKADRQSIFQDAYSYSACLLCSIWSKLSTVVGLTFNSLPMIFSVIRRWPCRSIAFTKCGKSALDAWSIFDLKYFIWWLGHEKTVNHKSPI